MKKSLEELRKFKRLTQIEVAGLLGVDQTTVSKWESGEAMPRAQTLFDVADLYGVKVDDIEFCNGGKRKRKVFEELTT